MIPSIARQMAKADLLKIIRNRRSVFMLFIMPIVLIAILSSAFGNVFGGKGIPKFTVAVYNQDEGQAGRQMINFLSQQKSQLAVKSVSSIDAARRAVATGSAGVDLLIPQDFSDKVTRGDATQVKLETPLNHDMQKSVLQGMINAYAQSLADMKFLGAQSAKVNRPIKPQVAQIEQKDPGMYPIGAGAYYAIGMMVMFMLSNAIHRGANMVEERQSDLYKRMVASPASRYALTVGHWLANFLVLFVQGAVLLTCARYLLGIHFGPIAQTVLLLGAYSFSLSGITIVLGVLIKNQSVMSALANIGSQVASVLGGSIWPIYNFPKAMQSVSHVLPNGTAITAMVDSVMGIDTKDLITPLLYMVGVGLILGIAAGTRYARRLV